MSNVLMQTNFGDITIELNHEKAPITAANFEQYVRDGFYDGVIFHRVIDGFMVQGGGFDVSMDQKETRANIENEADNGLKNDEGTLAMARTMDPHSASAQFFITWATMPFLTTRVKTHKVGATQYLVKSLTAWTSLTLLRKWPPLLNLVTKMCLQTLWSLTLQL